MSVFVKCYTDPDRAARAAGHLTWLSTLDSGVRLPRLLSVAGDRLVLEHLNGHQPGPEHLPIVAAALGQLHAAAHARHLNRAALNRPYDTGDLVIPDFVSPRLAALERHPIPYAGLPTALYKDANIRNFVLTDDGATPVDFDDLTLAPFGYDLAKLIVSTAMTHGRLHPDRIDQALTVYNARVGGAACRPDQLHGYAEMHHMLTARYLNHTGYRHPWPQVRPWPAPISHR